MAGKHRAVVGGDWEELGQFQVDFLVAQGLKQHHTLLDIGCGSLRGGVKLIKYLDAENYFGTDLNGSLLSVGYDIELAKAGLTAKLPRSHLIVDGDFDYTWCARPFDFVLAQSVFTHLPLGFVRICLERLCGVVKPDGRLFMTIHEIPADHPADRSYRQPGGIVSYGGKNPYHHRYSDIALCAQNLPWAAKYIGAWNHPHGQKIVQFTRSR
ncbi:MAG: class I SAM-dependent methyltransferase [Rhizobiales bacterium]|nr:class I SAM-dependent methyltransferase [Hyphomicrobiales bacterium]